MAIAMARAREDSGLIQSEAAEQLGVDAMTLSRYERGIRRPDSGVLAKMAVLYERSIDQLLGRTDMDTSADIVRDAVAAASRLSPLAEHVLETVGRMKELADQIVQLANQTIGVAKRQENLSNDLARRAERGDSHRMDDRPHLPSTDSDYPGRRIMVLREKAGMTRLQLGKKVGYRNEEMIRKLEVGIVREVPPARRARFAAALGVPESKIFAASTGPEGRAT